MLKNYHLDAISNFRKSSIDNNNLIIRSLGSHKLSEKIRILNNGKTKIRTGLPSRHVKNLSNIAITSPDPELSFRPQHSNNPKGSCKTSLDDYKAESRAETLKEREKTLERSSDFLIVKQTKIALYEEYKNKKQNLKNLYTSLSQTPATNKRKIKKDKLERIALRDAAKDKEWLSTAKPKIIHSINRQICRSNALEINCFPDIFFTYKYYIGPGNNSKLLKQCISQRWWWVRVPSTEMYSANFVWTQWCEQKFLDSLPSLSKLKQQKDDKFFPKIGDMIYTNHSQSGLNHRKIVDLSSLGFDKITQSSSFTSMQINSSYVSQYQQLYNKIDYNFLLSNKKALFYNLKQYYEAFDQNVFEYIPITFHICKENDTEFNRFIEYYKSCSSKSLWILKPGENTNRGNGIIVLNSIESIVKEIKNNLSLASRTIILQKYIENPFLINERKFDIRCYALLTSINGILQCYFYEEGYLRTSSKKFSTINTANLLIHLTNDAVQKKSEGYGKFESGNKLTYADFQDYLDSCGKKVSFVDEILQKIKMMVKDTVQAVFLKIDPHKRAHSFEIFGYDFLIDEDLRPWLIEVNTNPCLELSCCHLARIIPAMIDNAFKIVVDPIFPEPQIGPKRVLSLTQNKFELIFHSYTDGVKLIYELLEKNSLQLVKYINPVIVDIKNEHSLKNSSFENEESAINK